MPYSLLEVVYWVVKGRTLSGEKIKTYYYDDYFVDDDGVIEWHDGENHPKWKAQKAQIKRVNAYCLAPIKILGLVYVRRWKEGDRKIVDTGRNKNFS